MSTNSKASQFFAAHARRSWSPVFNGMLEAMIHDPALCMELRAVAWIVRYSWGNHCDSVGEGNKDYTQTDFARMIGLLDTQGKPGRRAVSPAFSLLKRQGIIRTEGHVIFPVDDPTFADSSQIVEDPSHAANEGRNLPTFRAFIEEIVAREHPDKFKAYQEAGEKWKQIKTDLLHLYDDYAGKTSATPSTMELERLRALRQKVSEPEDIVSEGVGHSADASLLIKTSKNLIGASSSFSVIRRALESHGLRADDDVVLTLFNECRKNAADATEAEIAGFVHEKAQLITAQTKNPIGFLLTIVPKCFHRAALKLARAGAAQAAAKTMSASEAEIAERETPEAQIGQLERMIEGFPNHDSIRQWRERLRILKAAQKGKP